MEDIVTCYIPGLSSNFLPAAGIIIGGLKTLSCEDFFARLWELTEVGSPLERAIKNYGRDHLRVHLHCDAQCGVYQPYKPVYRCVATGEGPRRRPMNQVKKSVQGAVTWAVVPGLVCLAFLLKMASGLFSGGPTRLFYLDVEFKSDLVYLFLSGGIMALAFFFARSNKEKTPTE